MQDNVITLIKTFFSIIVRYLTNPHVVIESVRNEILSDKY